MSLERMGKQKVMFLKSVLITACISFFVPELAKTCQTVDLPGCRHVVNGHRLGESAYLWPRCSVKTGHPLVCSPLGAVPATCDKAVFAGPYKVLSPWVRVHDFEFIFNLEVVFAAFFPSAPTNSCAASIGAHGCAGGKKEMPWAALTQRALDLILRCSCHLFLWGGAADYSMPCLDSREIVESQMQLGTSRTELVSFQGPRSRICLHAKIKTCL